MKKVIYFACCAFAVLTFLSCSAPLSARMENYVSDVESRCDQWTAQDWELSQEEYNQLIAEYEANYDTYTQEEKNAINKAIGRYNGLLLKQGLNEIGSTIEEIGNQIPSLIEGFMSAFE